MAINVVVDDPQLTVLGPPDSITLNVNTGETGTRGSYIYNGSGDPNTNTSISDFILGDLYIRTDTGDDYGVVYQYVSLPGGPEWQKIINFSPIVYNEIQNLTFASGSVSASVSLADFYVDAPASIAAEDFVVQLTAEKSNPVAIAHTKTLTSGATKSLILNLNAAEFSSASWQYLSGSANINIGISVI
jgi:hypothetical protein